MKKKNKLFGEILYWTYERHENGFSEQDLKKDLNLSDNQFIWYSRVFRGGSLEDENLVRHLEYIDSKNEHRYTLTAKGISRHKELQKPWHEKTWGKIFLILLGVILGVIVPRLFDYLLYLLSVYL